MAATTGQQVAGAANAGLSLYSLFSGSGTQSSQDSGNSGGGGSSYKIQGRDAFSSTATTTGLSQLGNTLIYPPGATPPGAPNAITSGLPKEILIVGLVMVGVAILHKHAKV